MLINLDCINLNNVSSKITLRELKCKPSEEKPKHLSHLVKPYHNNLLELIVLSRLKGKPGQDEWLPLVDSSATNSLLG